MTCQLEVEVLLEKSSKLNVEHLFSAKSLIFIFHYHT